MPTATAPEVTIATSKPQARNSTTSSTSLLTTGSLSLWLLVVSTLLPILTTNRLTRSICALRGALPLAFTAVPLRLFRAGSP